MRIAISGYGRMGKRIRQMALERGYEVVAVIDPFSQDEEVTSKTLTVNALGEADVVIDFSVPSAVYDNIIMYAKTGIPAVIGTTGWHDSVDELKSLLEGEKYKILYSGNYSIGVAVTLKLAEAAAKLMNNLPTYDVSVHEVHHKEKADSPSGTALMLANVLKENMDRKTSIDTECQHSKRGEDVIHLSSERVGWNPGRHTITFDSEVDTIEITHQARSRDGFASGALYAASYLVSTDKEGFLTMDDFINDFLGVN